MRTFQDKACTKIKTVNCNCCGRALRVEKGIVKEGCFYGSAHFGYFSKKDGISQSFDLCEDCYDRIVQDFVIPVTRTEEKELC